MPALGEMLGHVLATQPAPPRLLVGGAALAALAAIVPQRAWRVSRNAVTIAHEGGHAVVALASGRRLTGLRLHADTSGLTTTKGRSTGPALVLTAAAGYVTPSLLGVGAAGLLAAGHVTAMLWASLVLLAAILTKVRNVFGVLSVVATGALVFWVSWFAATVAQAAFAYFMAWFLLGAGVRDVVVLQQQRRRGWAHSDADQLAQLTGMPGILWVLGFGLVTVAALLVAAGWLWR